MPTVSTLTQALTRRRIQQLAFDASFKRGEVYFDEGRVRSLVVRGVALTATVSGTEDYSVRLAVEDGALQHRCSCPVGADGEFCKHGVAVALAWLAAARGETPGEAASPVVKLDDVRPFLLTQDKETLATWLLDAAERDERLRERLLRQAAHATSKGVDFAAYRRSIDRATKTGGFVDYRAERLVAQTNNAAYADTTQLLNKAKVLLLRLGHAEEWGTAIGKLRLAHKAKRNFVALAAKL